MSPVIFKTQYAVFMFDQKQMKELIARKKSEYDRDELAKLLRVISNKSNETILNPEDHYYFGFVVLDLISAGMGKVTCNIGGKTYDASQLKEFGVGYEREKEKFQSMMDETRELAISALREEFAKTVNGLTEKLNKDSTQLRVIKSSMFNKMREFLDGFGTRNIFEDEVLVELSQQAKALIEGVSPDGIKKNDVMLQKIKNEMNELKFAVDSAIEDMPRRKIRMAS